MPRPIRGLRWYIGGLLFLSTVINYIDRQTLNVLAPILKDQYKWTNADFALIVIAFRAAYAIGQTASGRFIHRHRHSRLSVDSGVPPPVPLA